MSSCCYYSHNNCCIKFCIDLLLVWIVIDSSEYSLSTVTSTFYNHFCVVSTAQRGNLLAFRPLQEKRDHSRTAYHPADHTHQNLLHSITLLLLGIKRFQAHQPTQLPLCYKTTKWAVLGAEIWKIAYFHSKFIKSTTTSYLGPLHPKLEAINNLPTSKVSSSP